MFRYLGDKGRKNPQQNKKHEAARKMWQHIREEFNNKQALIYIPDEVRRELEIQQVAAKVNDTKHQKNMKKAVEFANICEYTIPTKATIEIEHLIRRLTAFISANFNIEIPIEYGGVSDARILHAAYMEDGIIVTNNTKDFALYPFLFEQGSKVLYNIEQKGYVIIPKELYINVTTNPTFWGMRQEFFDLSEAINDSNSMRTSLLNMKTERNILTIENHNKNINSKLTKDE